jgi:hypothetical protein
MASPLSARMLGISVPEDMAVDENGFVKPETGGMPVALNSAWNILSSMHL